MQLVSPFCQLCAKSGKVLLGRHYKDVRNKGQSRSKTVERQLDVEQRLIALCSESDRVPGQTEVASMDNHIIAFKQQDDLLFVISGSDEYDELELFVVVETLCELVEDACKGKLNEASIVEHYSKVSLYLDELVVEGLHDYEDCVTIKNLVQMKIL